MKQLTYFKEGIRQNSILVNSIIATNVAATIVTVGTLGVGGMYIQQEQKKERASVEQTKNDDVVATPSFLAQNSFNNNTFPVVTFKGQEYATPKSMYYAILTWYQKSGSSTPEEVEIIKQMYQMVKHENGQYWELLQSHEWTNVLEQS